MRPVFEVLAPGLLATLQDFGRRGQRSIGVAASGAMDAFALQAANVLCGNPRGTAVLEMAMQGPVLRTLDDTVAVLGGVENAMLDGCPVPAWKSMLLRKHQTLDLSAPFYGAFGYLAVAGGFDVPVVLGSRSTYLRAALGGFQGRTLRKGDVLEAAPQPPASRPGRFLSQDQLPNYAQAVTVRVMPGPHAEYFGAHLLDVLCRTAYLVAAQSDRMGYRLHGLALARTVQAELPSEAMVLGAVQIPPDGQPIVLLADHQTTGGYPVLAVVISADLPLLAQLKPSGKVAFRVVALEEAYGAALEFEYRLLRLQTGCNVR